MAAAIPKTPQKIYSTSNVCSLCGFSFVIKEIDKEGNIQIKKLVKLKLRLTEEKQTAIREVTQTDLPPNAEGVCTRCYAKVEKVLRYKKEIRDILENFQLNMKRNMAKTPGSSTRKKRLRSSPKPNEKVSISKANIVPATCDSGSEAQYRHILPATQGPQDKGFPGQENLETSAVPAKEELGKMTYFLLHHVHIENLIFIQEKVDCALSKPDKEYLCPTETPQENL